MVLVGKYWSSKRQGEVQEQLKGTNFREGHSAQVAVYIDSNISKNNTLGLCVLCI